MQAHTKRRKLIFLAFLVHCSIIGIGQRIDFKNDSLFINNQLVNWSTSKSTLDSLLNAKGKVEKKKGKYIPNKTRIVEIVNWTIYTYKKQGLIFRKNDSDTINLNASVKLSRNSNPVVDVSNMPTRVFKGQLFIDINLMNDIKDLTQLQQLKNCTVTGKTAYDINIIYQKRRIMVLTDFMTGQLISVSIH